MDEAQFKALRDPFDPSMIGKLPKAKKKDDPNNKFGHCNECGKWHVLPAVHLDYVGHAAVTDRLLKVDPAWSWEPMCVGPNGEPLIVNGGLWIKLTIAGVTRPGWGDGPDIKVMIGDAIRNAAMRFGVALDLWAKEDLHAFETDGKSPPKAKKTESPEANGNVTEEITALIDKLTKSGILDAAAVADAMEKEYGTSVVSELPPAAADNFLGRLKAKAGGV